VSTLCHEAGITAWVALAKTLDISVKWWAPPCDPTNKNPKLSLATLKPLLTPKTRLVTCGHVNNVLGSIHDIRAVADLVHTVPGALLCVDGVAWAPHRAIDVRAMDVDFYVFSWYKVFGPHLAQLYARRRVHTRWMTSLNHYHLDSTTLDTKLAIGTNCHELENCLLPIMEYLEVVSWDRIAAYEEVITRPLLDYLNANPKRFTVYGEKSSDAALRVSCVSFEVNGISSEIIAHQIHEMSDFRIVWGDNYSVIAVHDILGVGDGGLVRVTLVHYNTVQEVCDFVRVLDGVVTAELERRIECNGVKKDQESRTSIAVNGKGLKMRERI
jgi:selenocysteine lyase/cysteine desulfurase